MNVIAGVDEVGRGCWAGPLLAAAVILHDSHSTLKISERRLLRDSKLMTRSQREVADIFIRQFASSFAIGWVNPEEVDELGLTTATGLAMQRAVDQLSQPYDRIIIDGNYNYLPNMPNTETLIKADDLIPAVSAASIIAKVARDKYMADQAMIYPNYGFEAHVGYGTKKHIEALSKYGVTAIHRKSYKPIKAFL
jgi:ribonuclease HII